MYAKQDYLGTEKMGGTYLEVQIMWLYQMSVRTNRVRPGHLYVFQTI
jgi:hypothetical protein